MLKIQSDVSWVQFVPSISWRNAKWKEYLLMFLPEYIGLLERVKQTPQAQVPLRI